jgi:hypothetical protein
MARVEIWIGDQFCDERIVSLFLETLGGGQILSLIHSSIGLRGILGPWN